MITFPFPFLNIFLFSPKFLTVLSPLCLVFDILLTNPHQNFNHISKTPLTTLRCTKYSIDSTLGKKSLPGPSDASWEHSCHAGISHCRTQRFPLASFMLDLLFPVSLVVFSPHFLPHFSGPSPLVAFRRPVCLKRSSFCPHI